MYEAALGYLKARDLLSSRTTDFGDAQPVLGVLTFEILLKCACLIVLGKPVDFGHDYKRGWRKLPREVQDSLLLSAKECQGPHTDFSNVDGLLEDFKRTFVQARYSYEANQDMSDDELREKGREWVEQGSPMDKADFRFHPMELDSMIYALGRHIQQKLGLPPVDLLSDIIRN